MHLDILRSAEYHSIYPSKHATLRMTVCLKSRDSGIIERHRFPGNVMVYKALRPCALHNLKNLSWVILLKHHHSHQNSFSPTQFFSPKSNLTMPSRIVHHIDRKELYTNIESRIHYLHSFLDFSSSTFPIRHSKCRNFDSPG